VIKVSARNLRYDVVVKSLGAFGTLSFALMILGGGSAFAQARGIPASVSSPTSNFGRGVPASVSSPGPFGFVSVDGIGIKSNGFRHSRIDRLGRRHNQLPVVVPFWYLQPVYDAQPQPQVVERVVERGTDEPQRIIVEIRDTRPAAEPAPAAKPSTGESKTAPPPQEVPEIRIATIFIFQDGSRKELVDFAIMGKDLIDLAGGRTRRFPLKDVDREATLKVNAENGIDVRFPTS
jgi:hypothetical protein